MGGKTVTRLLSEEQLARHQAWFDNARRLKELTAKLQIASVHAVEQSEGWWKPVPTRSAVPSGEHLPAGEDDDTIDIAVTPDGGEWWIADRDGDVSTAPLGGVEARCDPPEIERGYATGIDRTPGRSGYWLVTTYGEVFACGDATHHGDVSVDLAAPIVDNGGNVSTFGEVGQ